MNRATAVLAEWDARAGHSPASLRDQQQRDEISRLRRQLQDNRKERHRLRHQVDAAATVVATLLTENAALRQQLANRSAKVIPLQGASELR
ncbi:hypothetical protein AB0D34_37985 [Streptomyces sp. NPDC048420]|uniref:hypothetical protein n=1 Tax=Streptomyces sp. NPDC048420 TaxID=3155755 RepID=UPI00341FE662